MKQLRTLGVSILAILITTSVLALTGCVSNTNNPPPSGTSVSIGEYFFSPQDISIHVGDNVTWTNNGAISHTVTSNATGGPMNSALLGPGQTYTVHFTVAGVYNYHCSIHPTMMWGTVTVT